MCPPDGASLSLMLAAVFSRMSIIAMLPVLLLFILISALAVRYSLTWPYLILIVGKGVCLGLCMYMILLEFASAGWLVCKILMFSDGLLMIPLFYLVVHHADTPKKTLMRDTLTCVVVAVAAVLADYRFISPWIVTLLDNF